MLLPKPMNVIIVIMKMNATTLIEVIQNVSAEVPFQITFWALHIWGDPFTKLLNP